METYQPTDPCPQCSYHRLRAYHELTDAEKLLANCQPASAEFTLAERKKHRFCTRCWHEEFARATEA